MDKCVISLMSLSKDNTIPCPSQLSLELVCGRKSTELSIFHFPEGAKFGAINKSRYGSVSSYLSDCSLNGEFNDIDLVYDPETYEVLKEAGINELVAKHISHLFIRYFCFQQC